MTSIAEALLDPSALSGHEAEKNLSVRAGERRMTFLVAAVGILILLIAFWPAFEKAAGWMDEGMILAYPGMIQHGKLPYRDFETFYGPANPVLLAAAFSLAGTSIFVERVVGLFYRLLILLAIFAIVRRWGTMLAGGCLLIAGCLLLGTALPAFAWLGAMACALWSLWAGGGAESGRKCFCAGLLAAFALLYRVDVGPAIVLSALPLLWGMGWRGRRYYFGGGAVGLLPLGVLALTVGGKPILENLFLLPVFHTSQGRHLPIFSADTCLIGLFFTHLIAASVNVFAGAIAMRPPSRDRRAPLLLALGLFGLGLTHQAAQRMDSLHLLFAAFISVGTLPLSLVVLAQRFAGRTLRTGEVLLAVVGVVASVQTIAPELTVAVRTAFVAGFHTDVQATFVEHNGRSFPFDSPKEAATVEMMLAKLSALSAPGHRLFVGPADLRRTNYNDTYIYYMMPELVPATYFLEMNPLSANRPNSPLATDIASADLLVLDRALDSWNEPNLSVSYGSDAPNAVVRKDFEPCGEFSSFSLYRHKPWPRPSVQPKT